MRAGEHAPSLDALKEDVVFEGWLQKKSNKGLSGLKPWQRRYFVLYRSANELRYYKNMTPSRFGNLYVGERGSIPLDLIRKVLEPEVKQKFLGLRFDLDIVRPSNGKYPGTLCDEGSFREEYHRVCLLAGGAEDKKRWVEEIQKRLRQPLGDLRRPPSRHWDDGGAREGGRGGGPPRPSRADGEDGEGHDGARGAPSRRFDDGPGGAGGGDPRDLRDPRDPRDPAGAVDRDPYGGRGSVPRGSSRRLEDAGGPGHGASGSGSGSGSGRGGDPRERPSGSERGWEGPPEGRDRRWAREEGGDRGAPSRRWDDGQAQRY